MNVISGSRTFHLGHVFNLSRIIARISKSPLWSPDEVLEFRDALATVTGARNSPAADEALNRLLTAAHGLNQHRPTWAARWTHFKLHVDRQPRAWNAAVGVSRSRTSLQLVFRYPAKSLTLIRPTQLDVGYHAYHFPSPPHLDVSLGGIAMSLSRLNPSRKWPLVSEYIHAPVCFTSEDWRRGGSWLGESPAESLNPQEYRDRHCERLANLPAARADSRILEWIHKIGT